MSQGIALEFRCKFGQINLLKEQNKNVTEIAHIKHNEIDILYIITKEIIQQKLTLEKLFKSIIKLQKCYGENEIHQAG